MTDRERHKRLIPTLEDIDRDGYLNFIDRAEEMGLDPARWFRNVELAVLEIVGQETVQYVNNINKRQFEAG